MKILLIYPYFLDERIQSEDIEVPPIGLYYVGAMLKENDYDVEILNWHHIHKFPEKITRTLEEKNPDVIGFSILHANRWGGIEIARIAKRLNPKVKIIFGGVGATHLWKHFLTHFREIDAIVVGEGEYAFLELVRCFEKGTNRDMENIKSIAYRKGKKAMRTEDGEPVQNLDHLPNPAEYFVYQHVVSSRGCPWNCTFCGSPQFWGRRVRFHSPEYFVAQLEQLNKKGVRFFFFSDDTFALRKTHAMEICKKIIERDLKITWAAISRVSDVDEEILAWMRKAGCIQISYGIESGSEKIRKTLNKHLNDEKIRKAFKLTKKYGILARAYFIYGSPGETWDTIQKSIDLIRDIQPLSIIFYILDLFPGTKLYSDFKTKTGTSDDIWLKRIEDVMYFETDPQLSQEQILAFGEKLRGAFHESLRDFVDAIQLIDDKTFDDMHADFLSRLGMTFSHGDYARIDAIKEKDEIAERLYRRALAYSHDHRAYLGLGIIKQKRAAYEESIRLLNEAIQYFPNSEPLHIGLGISYLNIGAIEKALSCFLEFQDSKDAMHYIAACYRALGDFEKESIFLKRLDSTSPQFLPMKPKEA